MPFGSPSRPGKSTTPGSMEPDWAGASTRAGTKTGTKPVWVMMSMVIAAVLTAIQREQLVAMSVDSAHHRTR